MLYPAELPGLHCAVTVKSLERRFWRKVNGGAEGDRTPDLRIANATLSQLSYGPMMRRLSAR